MQTNPNLHNSVMSIIIYQDYFVLIERMVSLEELQQWKLMHSDSYNSHPIEVLVLIGKEASQPPEVEQARMAGYPVRIIRRGMFPSQQEG